MDLTASWSLDDVARSTDHAVVRRRYDQRNLFWTFLLLVFFSLVSIVALFGDDIQDLPELVFANASAVLVALALLLFRGVRRVVLGTTTKGWWRLANWAQRHLSATILTWLALQYAFVLGFAHDGESWVPWIMTVPMFMLGYRMAVAELVLLHVYLLAAGMGMALFSNSGKDFAELLIGAASVNGVMLGIELLASYRMRREVIAEWTRLRSHAREQIRMRDELRYARELQLSMLPERSPDLPWLDVASVCIPATEVGGDYFDYFVGPDRVALVCGDVAGHGMASGLVLSAIRSGFTLLRDSLTNPAAVLQRLHDLVAETSRRRMLVTVSVVLVDHATSEATIASAGHPPVIVRRAGGSVETIDLFAPPLGVRLPVDIPQRRVAFGPGDVFVLHSDGIYETRNDRDESFGMDRLVNVVRDHEPTSAESMRETILTEVARFRGSAIQDDDLTVVVCRMVG